nr:MAG TPA: YsxB-like protein [Caudoviricetes sp.]
MYNWIENFILRIKQRFCKHRFKKRYDKKKQCYEYRCIKCGKGVGMTTITYIDKGLIIDGHAENPVACHGISAIGQMVANFVEERDWGKVHIRDGHLEITDVKDEVCGDTLFQAMKIAFEDIAQQYSDCVKIARG